MIRFYKYILFAFLVLVLHTLVFSQSIRINGVVVDAETGELLPYVNLSFLGTENGGVTDINGRFVLKSEIWSDTLEASFVGYEKFYLVINKRTMNDVRIELKPDVMKLGEVVIRAGQNPAMILLKLINEKRQENKLKYLDYYSYDVYNKLEFDLNNLQGKLDDRALLKPFSFLNEYVDTAEVSGKAFLPFFISETFSVRYHSNVDNKEIEHIKGNKISGINNESLRRYTGDMYQDVNIYDHTISVLGKGFISPIGRMGKSYYNYVLSDTAWQDNRWCYKLEFTPKRKYEPTIEGYIWVNDTSFAVKSFRVSLSETASINFVDSLVAEKHFIEVADSVWMISYDNLLVDFNLFDRTEGFFGRKTSYYSNHKLNHEVDKSVFNESNATNLVYKPEADSETDEYWDKKRPVSLSQRERNIYKMVDTIKEVKVFKRWENFITTIVSGYFRAGYVEIGPVFSFISNNPVEGHRLRFGLRTSRKFSKKLQLKGYGAYGFGDKNWKYGGGVTYMFSNLPRRSVHFDFVHDYIQVVDGLNALRTDNLLGTLLRRPGVIHMHYADQWKIKYDHEIFEGFSAYAAIETQRIFSPKDNPYLLYGNFNNSRSGTPDLKDFIQGTEFILGLHFAADEKFIRGYFNQISLGTKKPKLNLKLAYAPPKIFDNRHEYIKVTLNMQHKIPLYPVGVLHYAVEGGKVHGKMYYPFLFVHQGNQSFSFYDYSFNLMNFYEFVSDQYVSFYAEQRFEGFFLNHIPLMRRLDWREHVGFKATYGTLSEKSKSVMYYPEFIHSLPFGDCLICKIKTFILLRLPLNCILIFKA